MSWGELAILDSRALTKIQSAILVAIIVLAAVSGSLAYMFWVAPAQPAETIRIGVCADLDNVYRKATWQGAVLAAEQVNAEGGVLGRNLTIVSEDDDSETIGDIAIASNALTRLITVDKADYVVSPQSINVRVYQDICSEHKKIYFSVGSSLDADTQRVLDNYVKYKYFFRIYAGNSTSATASAAYSLQTLKNYTGFNKVALLVEDLLFFSQLAPGVKNLLPDYGFDVVYYNTFLPGTTDLSSYFSAIEASGAEILMPMVISQSCFSLVKEWYDRQSPLVMWGIIGQAQMIEFWELTDGKCESISFFGSLVASGYPFTNKTMPTHEAYLERWGDIPDAVTVAAYDTVRLSFLALLNGLTQQRLKL